MFQAKSISLTILFCAAAVSGALMAQSNRAPETHMVIANPANMTPDRAEAVYQAIRMNMRGHYLVSGDPVTGAYQSWRRYNKVPYRSSPHTWRAFGEQLCQCKGFSLRPV